MFLLILSCTQCLFDKAAGIRLIFLCRFKFYIRKIMKHDYESLLQSTWYPKKKRTFLVFEKFLFKEFQQWKSKTINGLEYFPLRPVLFNEHNLKFKFRSFNFSLMYSQLDYQILFSFFKLSSKFGRKFF